MSNLILQIMCVACLTAGNSQANLRLWYDSPAKEWTEALPIGNGRFGAMVFGGTAEERIQFNEDSLWFGKPHDYSHEGAAEYLPQIRQLLFEGKQQEAEKLAMEHFMSVPMRQMPYQPFGDLTLTFPGHEKAESYRRQLDLDAAVATTTYRVERGDVHPPGVGQLAGPGDRRARSSATNPAQISFTATLTSPNQDVQTQAVGARHAGYSWAGDGLQHPRQLRDEFPAR